jgi:hypothetical protein
MKCERRNAAAGALWQELLVFDEPKYRLPVRVNWLSLGTSEHIEHPGMIQGLRLPVFQNRLAYLRREIHKRSDTYGAPEHDFDRHIVCSYSSTLVQRLFH